MEMSDILMFGLFGFFVSEVMFLFADDDNGGVAFLSLLVGIGLVLTWWLVEPATLRGFVQLVPEQRWIHWSREPLTEFLSRDIHVLYFAVGWLVGVATHFLLVLFFVYPEGGFLELLGRYAGGVLVLAVVAFFFGSTPLLRYDDWGVDIDRRTAWRDVSSWVAALTTFGEDASGDDRNREVTASSREPTKPTRAKPSTRLELPRESKLYSGPGYAGLRVNVSFIVYLIAPPVVTRSRGGEPLLSTPITVEIYNDSYRRFDEVGRYLPEWPHVIVRAPDGRTVMESRPGFGGGIEAAGSRRFDLEVDAEDMREAGEYKLTLSIDGRSAEAVFHVR